MIVVIHDALALATTEAMSGIGRHSRIGRPCTPARPLGWPSVASQRFPFTATSTYVQRQRLGYGSGRCLAALCTSRERTENRDDSAVGHRKVSRQSPKELGGCTFIHVHVHYSRLFVYAARRRVQSMHATVKFQASRRISYVSCPSLPPPYAWTPYRYRQILKKNSFRTMVSAMKRS